MLHGGSYCLSSLRTVLPGCLGADMARTRRCSSPRRLKHGCFAINDATSTTLNHRDAPPHTAAERLDHALIRLTYSGPRCGGFVCLTQKLHLQSFVGQRVQLCCRFLLTWLTRLSLQRKQRRADLALRSRTNFTASRKRIQPLSTFSILPRPSNRHRHRTWANLALTRYAYAIMELLREVDTFLGNFPNVKMRLQHLFVLPKAATASSYHSNAGVLCFNPKIGIYDAAPNGNGGTIPSVRPSFTPRTRENFIGQYPWNNMDMHTHCFQATHQPAI